MPIRTPAQKQRDPAKAPGTAPAMHAETRHAPKPTQYRAIALWGARLGSYGYYIAAEQARASAADAPVDAIYLRHNDQWATARDLDAGHHFLRKLDAMLRVELAKLAPSTLVHLQTYSHHAGTLSAREALAFELATLTGFEVQP